MVRVVSDAGLQIQLSCEGIGVRYFGLALTQNEIPLEGRHFKNT